MILKQKLREGSVMKELHLTSIRSTPIRIPDASCLVHLQFRRFAGCPVCDLHLRSIIRRHDELVAASIREVVVFHSSVDELLPYYAEFPFETVADPAKYLYKQFGVGSGLRALGSPLVWVPIVRGVMQSLSRSFRGRAPLPTLTPSGGRLGLPADFLIAPGGLILACKYGSHAYDQWSVDQILKLCGGHCIDHRNPRRWGEAEG